MNIDDISISPAAAIKWYVVENEKALLALNSDNNIMLGDFIYVCQYRTFDKKDKNKILTRRHSVLYVVTDPTKLGTMDAFHEFPFAHPEIHCTDNEMQDVLQGKKIFD